MGLGGVGLFGGGHGCDLAVWLDDDSFCVKDDRLSLLALRGGGAILKS